MADNARQLRLLILFRATRSLAAGLIAIAFPYYVLSDLRFGASTLGLVYAMATLATAAQALLFGYLADFRSRKATLFLAGVVVPVSCLLAWFSGRLAILYIAAALGGFSATGSRAAGSVGGAAQPIQTSVIAGLTKVENRTFYFSLFTFLSGIFGAGGMLLAKVFSARTAFLAAFAISAAGLVFLLPMKIADPREPETSIRPASLKVIGKFSLTGAVNGLSQGLILPFLIPFFVIVYHLPREHMAVYGFLSELLSSVGMLLAPFIERRFGFVQGVAATRSVGALLLLLLPLTRSLPLALAVYVMTPALRVIAVPAQQTALTAMVREGESGRALGVNQVARLSGSTGAIVFTGYAFAAADIALPFYVYTGAIAFSLLLYFRLFGARPELRLD